MVYHNRGPTTNVHYLALTVELLQAKIQKTVGTEGAQVSDVLIRNDTCSLQRNYPATLIVKCVFAIIHARPRSTSLPTQL